MTIATLQHNNNDGKSNCITMYYCFRFKYLKLFVQGKIRGQKRRYSLIDMSKIGGRNNVVCSTRLMFCFSQDKCVLQLCIRSQRRLLGQQNITSLPCYTVYTYFIIFMDCSSSTSESVDDILQHFSQLFLTFQGRLPAFKPYKLHALLIVAYILAFMTSYYGTFKAYEPQLCVCFIQKLFNESNFRLYSYLN